MALAANDDSPPRAVCAVMRAETHEGRDNEFASLMSDLAFQVRTEEPGCSSYVVTRAMGSRQHFAIHAHFDDWAAFKDHAETPHLSRLLPRLNALPAAPLAMEIFLEA
jgi:quinol monooxygenase YgiN